MSADAFLKNLKAKKAKPFRDAILFARSEARTDGARDFINSCEKFLDKAGFLTEKQVEALYKMNSLYYPESIQYDNEDDDFGIYD